MASGPVKAGEAYVELGVKDAIDKGLRDSKRKFNAFASQTATIGATLTGASAAVLAAPLLAASRAEETMNKFNVVFGASSRAVEKWASDTGDAMNVARVEMLDMVAAAQDLLVPMGVTETAAQGMSKEITTLAVDLASFNNMNSADTFRDLQAAITGSGEVMKKYGVVLDVAATKQELLNMGLDPKTADNAAKAQARLNLILRGTTAAQGDAVRSADSFANSTKGLLAAVSNLSVTLGGPLLNDAANFIQIASAGVQTINDFAASHTGLVTILGRTAAILGGTGAALLGVAAATKVALIAVQGYYTALKVGLAISASARAAGIVLQAAYVSVSGGAKAAQHATVLLTLAQRTQATTAAALAAVTTTLTGAYRAGAAAQGVYATTVAVLSFGLGKLATVARVAWAALTGPIGLFIVGITAAATIAARFFGLFKRAPKREFKGSLVDAERIAKIEAEIAQEQQAAANEREQREQEQQQRAEQILAAQRTGAEKRAATMREINELEKSGALTSEQAQRARASAYTKATQALQLQVVELTRGAEAADRMRLANEGLSKSEIDHQIALQKTVDNLKKRQELQRDFDARLASVKSELAALKLEGEELLKHRLLAEGFTAEQAKQLAILQHKLDTETEIKRKQEEQRKEIEKQNKQRAGRQFEQRIFAAANKAFAQGVDPKKIQAGLLQQIRQAEQSGRIDKDTADRARKRIRDEEQRTQNEIDQLERSLRTPGEVLQDELKRIDQLSKRGLSEQGRERAIAAANKRFQDATQQANRTVTRGTFSSAAAFAVGRGSVASRNARNLESIKRSNDAIAKETKKKPKAQFT